jgi:hypothetical protein
MAQEWTRVKDNSTGHEYTVGVVDPAAHTILKDKDAVDMYGVPLPAKPNMRLGARSEKKEEKS